LEKVRDAVPRFVMKTGLWDFNAKVGKASHFTPSMWRAMTSQRNGKLVVHFALGRDSAVTGTQYQHKDIQKVTWIQSDNKICNQLDNILADRRERKNICDVRSMRGAGIQTDHFLVRAKI
jgi:hypothetical protein